MQMDWPHSPGIHDLEFVCGDAARARGSLALPTGGTAGAPLVLCLHYGGTPIGHYGRPLLEQLVASAWQRLGAVMLAPVNPHGDWTHPQATKLTLDLVAQVAARYGCGPRLVTGYSLGAIGTWHLVHTCPDEFVAAVPMAGPPPAAAAGNTPVRALVSDADRLFPAAATFAAVESLAKTGRDAACIVIEGVDHHAFGGFADALSALVPWLAACCTAGASRA